MTEEIGRSSAGARSQIDRDRFNQRIDRPTGSQASANIGRSMRLNVTVPAFDAALTAAEEVCAVSFAPMWTIMTRQLRLLRTSG